MPTHGGASCERTGHNPPSCTQGPTTARRPFHPFLWYDLSLQLVNEVLTVCYLYRTQGLTTPHHTLAFNRTVDITETPQLIDFQLLGLYLIVGLIVTGLGASPPLLSARSVCSWMLQVSVKILSPRGGCQ